MKHVVRFINSKGVQLTERWKSVQLRRPVQAKGTESEKSAFDDDRENNEKDKTNFSLTIRRAPSTLTSIS